MGHDLTSDLKRAMGVDVIRGNEALAGPLAAALVPKLAEDMIPVMLLRDSVAFADLLRKYVNQPGFDQAFTAVLDNATNDGLFEVQERDALAAVARNAAAEFQIIAKRGDNEVLILFAAVVQGEGRKLEATFGKGDGAARLAEIMKKSGFVADKADVAFLPTLFNPCDLAEAGPSAIRHAAASVGLSMLSENREAGLRRAAKSVSRRIATEDPVTDWYDDVTDTEVRFVLGGYYQKGPMKDMVLDALLMSAGKYDDAPDYLASRTRAFQDQASASLGVIVGTPGLVPRVSCDIGFVFAATSLLNEAGQQGFVSRKDPTLRPDDLVFVAQEGGVRLLAKFGNEVVASDTVPYQMVGGELQHFQRRLRTIHPRARPLLTEDGELEHGPALR